jgi:hypothetical protein
VPTEERDLAGSAIAPAGDRPDDRGGGVVAVVDEDDLGRDAGDRASQPA